MKLFGVAIAGFISNFLNFILMFLFFIMDSDMNDARVMPDRRVLRDLGPYLELGLPSVLMSLIDYWEWEQMTLASGFFGIK